MPDDSPLLNEEKHESKLASFPADGSAETQEGNEEELTGCGALSICNPHKAIHRYIFLIFMSLLGFGSYFVYDNPDPLQKHFLEDMDISVTQYSLMYSVYSYPNMILCFFGGFLIDRIFGLRWGAIIFSGFILFGQMIFALGSYVNHYWITLLGRAIFGLGGESLAVAQNLYGVSWFIGKELNMVLGLQISFSRVGSTANIYIMEPLYDALNKSGLYGYKCLGIALFIASVTCVMSLVCAIICAILDKRSKRILKKDEAATGEKIQITDVKDFPLTFWLISIICVTYYSAIFPFVSLGQIYFERKFGYDAADANFVDGITYIIAAVACPVFGILIDKTGRNIFWILGAVLVSLSSHCILCFTFVNPYLGMVILGVGYSMLACSLWPLVAWVIPEHQLGTAYGIMQSIQNTGLAIAPTIAGVIIDNKGFLQVSLFYIGLMSLSLFFIVWLYFHDASKGGTLNLTTKQRKLLALKKE